MCWSGEASTTLAIAGIGLTFYAAKTKAPREFVLVLGFFTLMEAIQAASYPVLGQCQNPVNIWLTRLSYLHIALHPFAFNALALRMIPSGIRSRIQRPVYALCALAAGYTLLQIIPFESAGICADHRAMCGAGFCTIPGTWHLAWEMPLNGWGNELMYNSNPLLRIFPHGLVGYGLGISILPLLYGAWKITAFHYLIGPIGVTFLSGNVDEQPAIWCLMAVGIAGVIVFTPLRHALRTRRWILWRFIPSVPRLGRRI